MRQIIFATSFLSRHPRAGEPTSFVPAIWSYYIQDRGMSITQQNEYLPFEEYRRFLLPRAMRKKNHTMRLGFKWKLGMQFNPKIWTGSPYRSKTLTIGPALTVKNLYTFEIECIGTRLDPFFSMHCMISGKTYFKLDAEELRNFESQHRKNAMFLAHNDGLKLFDWLDWFCDGHYEGQIICWAPTDFYSAKLMTGYCTIKNLNISNCPR